MSPNWFMPPFIRQVFALLMLAALSVSARADRNVLAPRGLIAVPNSAQIEFVASAANGHSNLGWLTVGLPIPDVNLELEAAHFELGGKRNETFSLQYSPLGNLLSREAPVVSVGIRDVLRRGPEGQALFVAATKTLGLSQRQERVLRDWKLHLGVGSSRLGGPFIGVQGRFAMGFTVSAEYAARRFNASIAWPVGRRLLLKASVLNGETFYGASFVVVR